MFWSEFLSVCLWTGVFKKLWVDFRKMRGISSLWAGEKLIKFWKSTVSGWVRACTTRQQWHRGGGIHSTEWTLVIPLLFLNCESFNVYWCLWIVKCSVIEMHLLPHWPQSHAHGVHRGLFFSDDVSKIDAGRISKLDIQTFNHNMMSPRNPLISGSKGPLFNLGYRSHSLLQVMFWSEFHKSCCIRKPAGFSPAVMPRRTVPDLPDCLDEWCTMVCSRTRSKVKVKVTSPSKLEIWLFSKAISSAIYNGRWQLTTDYKLGHNISKSDQAQFLIFGLIFVSRDFDVGTNVSCEKSTVSPHTGLILVFSFSLFFIFSAMC